MLDWYDLIFGHFVIIFIIINRYKEKLYSVYREMINLKIDN